MLIKISLIAAFGFFLMGAATIASASEGAGPSATPAVHSILSATLPVLGARNGTGIVVAENESSSDAADSDSDSDSNDDDQANSDDPDRQDRQDQMDQQSAG